MRKRSRTTTRRANRKRTQKPAELSNTRDPGSAGGHGFVSAFNQMVGAEQWRSIEQAIGRRRGAPARVPLTQILMSLVYHFFNAHGSFSEHVRQLFGIDYSDSSASERRQALPWEVFARLMRAALGPLAQKKRHPEAFYRRWRLLAIDGVQFSLNNTPAIKKASCKAKSRRGRAAFLKMRTSVLLELGLHNPLAAAIGRKQESELSLSCGLLAQLPAGCLLLADRILGYGAVLAPVLDRCREVASEFLVRVQRQVEARVIRRLPDGSSLVDVAVRQKGNTHRVERHVRLREIRVRVHRRGFRPQELRLWTSILDWRQAPAMEMAELYAQRWEQELYFRQLKYELRRSERLQSQTVETGAQEIATWIISSALIARERARAAKGQVPVLRVSFSKLLDLLRPLWVILSVGSDLLSEDLQRALTDRVLEEARRCLTPKRRERSCPRAVRQPVTGWPRLRRNQYWNDPVQLTISSPKR